MPVHRYFGPEAAEELGNSSILEPSGNVWRIEKARRARMLVDAAEYFGVLRAAMLRARRSLIVVGWDIDSRTRFVGPGGEADDGYPELFGDFLKRLAGERPGLEIKLLLWDYSVIYATERELLPALPLRLNTPANIDFCLDNQVPFGGSHHQKIVVIDGCLAFCGGIDLTVRRWDTSAHDPENRWRVDQAMRLTRRRAGRTRALALAQRRMRGPRTGRWRQPRSLASMCRSAFPRCAGGHCAHSSFRQR